MNIRQGLPTVARFLVVYLGIFQIGIGGYFLLFGGAASIEDNYWDVVRLPLVPTTSVLEIYPMSLIILGIFLIAFTRKFRGFGLPLWIMGTGAFDTFAIVIKVVLTGLGQLYFLQLILMIGGYAISRFPKFKLNWWLPVCIVLLIETRFSVFSGYGEHMYEAALFAYIYYGSKIRIRGPRSAHINSDEGDLGS